MTRINSIFGSIAAKFAIILVALGAMTTAAIVIGLLVFGALSDGLEAFIEENLPGIEASVDVTARTGEVQGALTDVLLAQEPEALKAAGVELSDGVVALKTAARTLPVAARDEIEPLLAELDVANAAMVRALERRFAEQARVTSLITAFVRLSDQANGALVSMADDAYFELQIGGEETVETVTTTLRGLVEREFAQMVALMEVRGEINLLTGLTLVLADEPDMFIEAILGDLASSSLGQLDAALAKLPPEAVDAEQMGQIREVVAFFRERQELKDYAAPNLRQDVLGRRQSSAAAVNSAIDDMSFALAIRAQEAANGNEAAIRHLMDVQVNRMRLSGEIGIAIKAVLAQALLGVASQDPGTAAGAQATVDGALQHLDDLLEGFDLPEQLVPILDEMHRIVSPDDGVVRARRSMLDSQIAAAQRSAVSGEAIARISEAARLNASHAVTEVVGGSEAILGRTDRARSQFQQIAIAGLVLLLIAPVVTWALILRPMARVTAATERLSRGDLSPVEGFERTGGEIGRMAGALKVFRDGMIEREEMQAAEREREARELERQRKEETEKQIREAEAREAERRREAEERAREAAEAEEREKIRAAAEEERQARAAEQQEVVDRLAAALDQLAAGDLTVAIETEFAGTYESLRQNFNAAVATLEDLITALAGSAGTVRTTSQDISAAAKDLARRTESSAATLEQTSAAVTELSESAGSTAERAKEADRIMQVTRENAVTSQGTVRNAVETMTEVEASSAAISKIVDLIDDIAFQTNLLALNAGVEAARAGEQGRGFAVVAMEVRSLAHRSSDAAKEINDLINSTRDRITRGVSQVGEAGDALDGILELVSSVSEQITAIAGAANEQSSGVREISLAVAQLDRATQDNAAMFEQSAASSQLLTEEARTLFDLSARFRTRDTAAPEGAATESHAAEGCATAPAAPLPQAAAGGDEELGEAEAQAVPFARSA
ncbi:methyl-accepting chemotaxis protein [Vannielia litorea]|uniref:methyl-accepting chemotaxis protein n=1 Tax=Vannielia litorea TaxID=1217970 RepID=UPI001C98B5C2|nr:HAMP domain-containing methyl-accepting chemotaxis protein [Vannielia litorea]MBY6048491.1 methyl-accepting chemotaxis protein [Vannielia litorea]MBY6075905.1 methyl-accepting chemotaxis protein [Vannielia litorea]